MGAIEKINWENEETQVSLNPRLKNSELQSLSGLATQYPLKGHVWIASSGSSLALNQSAKLIALSKRAFLISAQAVNEFLQSNSKDAWLQALPDFHVGGLSIRARSFLSGARVVSLEKWDAKIFHEKVAAEMITLSALVPTQVFDLIQAGLPGPSSLRAIVVGGSALSEELYTKALDLGWPLLPSYGMTECCSQIATASMAGLTHRDRQLKILPHIQAESNEGYLKIRSDALLTGVAQWKEGQAHFSDPKINGWLQTEDLCEISCSTLVPLGRGSEFVKVSGEGVSLLKLQHLLEKLAQEIFPDSWLDFAVIAVVDHRTQCQIGLASACEIDDLASRKLMERFNSEVAPYEKIKTIFKVQEIPRTALGKIAREKLKALI